MLHQPAALVRLVTDPLPLGVGLERIHTSQKRMRIKSGDTVMMELGAFYHRYMSA